MFRNILFLIKNYLSGPAPAPSPPLSSPEEEAAAQKLVRVVLENAATEVGGIRIIEAVRELVAKLKDIDSREKAVKK